MFSTTVSSGNTFLYLQHVSLMCCVYLQHVCLFACAFFSCSALSCLILRSAFSIQTLSAWGIHTRQTGLNQWKTEEDADWVGYRFTWLAANESVSQSFSSENRNCVNESPEKDTQKNSLTFNCCSQLTIGVLVTASICFSSTQSYLLIHFKYKDTSRLCVTEPLSVLM